MKLNKPFGPPLLFLVGELVTGGLQRQLAYLVEALRRQGFSPSVVVWNQHRCGPLREHFSHQGIPVVALAGGMGRWNKLWQLRYLVGRLAPALVHSYSFYTNFAAQWACWGTSVAAIGSARSDFSAEVAGAGPVLGRLCARWPRTQIFNSYAAARNARATWWSPARSPVVPNGVDLVRFSPRPLPSGRPQLAALGSLLPVKRWDRLLRLAARLQSRGLDFQVNLAGEGPLRRELEEQARRLGVAQRVRFLGEVSQVQELLANSRFLVHTSQLEGCPNALLEAMASARPILATPVGDCPRLVEEGRNGFLCPGEDEEAFASRAALLLSDFHLCREMGLAGRRKAEKELGVAHMVEKTLQVYRELGLAVPVQGVALRKGAA